MMSEISKYQRSKRAVAETIVRLWRQSLLAFSYGNNWKVNEINAGIEKLNQSISEIDARLEKLQSQR